MVNECLKTKLFTENTEQKKYKHKTERKKKQHHHNTFIDWLRFYS